VDWRPRRQDPGRPPEPTPLAAGGVEAALGHVRARGMVTVGRAWTMTPVFFMEGCLDAGREAAVSLWQHTAA